MQHADHEDKDEHGDVGLHWNEEHREANHRQRRVGPPEDADFAFPVGEGFCQCGANQVTDTVGGKEGDEYFRRAQDPGDVIHHRATAYADGEDIEDGQQPHDPPLVVLPDIAEIFAH